MIKAWSSLRQQPSRAITLLTVPWILLPLVLVVIKISLGPAAYNNYLIYKHVFWHVVASSNLYEFYPAEYLYQNHYGPSFSILIAPFALLPDVMGIMLWALCNALVLRYAILQLSISLTQKAVVMAIVLIEMTGAIQNLQFNPMLTAWMLLAFVYIEKGHHLRAALLISGGTLVKLYGILGLAFTPFRGQYKSMIIAMVAAMAILVCMPMLLSGPDFIMQSYHDWYLRLMGKNSENIRSNLTDGMQDLSAMGMIRRMTGWQDMPNLLILIPAAMGMLLPLFRRDQFSNPSFRLTYLAQVLIGMVIFSTSAESPTYVIAVCGFAIWYAIRENHSNLHTALLILLFLLTILSPTDIFPKQVKREWVNRYALKALPCVLAWFCITYDLAFSRIPSPKTPGHVPANTPAST